MALAEQISNTRVLKQALKRVLPARVQAGIRAYRARNQPDLRLIRALCDRARGSIEVGAMNGIFTFFIEWNSAWAVAFEPHPVLYQRLCGAFGPTVQVMPYAISDQAGTATLVLPHWHGEDQFGRATLEPAATAEFEPRTAVVETRTIDELNLAEIGFMKITAEGHELAILRGARTKIASDHPNIMVTLQDRLKPRLREDATAWLWELGFDGFFILNRELHPMSDFHSDLQRAENAPQPGGSSQAEYIFRFVFVHQSRPEVVDRLRAVPESC